MAAKKTTKNTDSKKAVKKTTSKKKTTTKKAETKKLPSFNVAEHMLVPKHEVLSDKDKKTLFEQYDISLKNLPKIKSSDPAIKTLDLKEGDVIKISRKSYTAGETVFYRGVIND